MVHDEGCGNTTLSELPAVTVTPSDELLNVLDRLGFRAATRRPIAPNHGLDGAANWHVRPARGERFVLRRYYSGTTPAELQYEHAILKHLSAENWSVPAPLAPAIESNGRWYCASRYVAGTPGSRETPAERRQRGRDLARLHLTLRSLTGSLGQRPGWQPLSAGLPVMTPVDWKAGLDTLRADHRALADWVAVAEDAITREFAGLVELSELPLSVLHGDFMGDQNVHYEGTHLAGVIDFGVAISAPGPTTWSALVATERQRSGRRTSRKHASWGGRSPNQSKQSWFPHTEHFDSP